VTDDDGAGKYVTLVLNPRMSTLLNLFPQRWPWHARGTRGPDRPGAANRVTQLQTTVTIPDGQTAMYRLYPARRPANLPTTNPADDVIEPAILLVKPTVVEAVEVKPKEFPLLSTKLREDGHTKPAPATQPRP
jgi:hypothetical protein